MRLLEINRGGDLHGEDRKRRYKVKVQSIYPNYSLILTAGGWLGPPSLGDISHV